MILKSAFSSVDFKSIVNSFLLEISQAPLLHCIGDSHVAVFRKVEKNHFWWHTRFKFCIVPGATATGLPNPNSTTQAYRIFREYLKSISVKDSILFCLGEVDCGFVIWWRAQKYNESVGSQTELAIQRYVNFIKEVQHMGEEYSPAIGQAARKRFLAEHTYKHRIKTIEKFI
jgi:hypothetical protein